MTQATPRPGTLLAERYRVERVLGRGGFGVTVQALDTDSGQRVAVKQLDLRRVDEWKSVELFEREAEVLRRLDHPKIPAYLGFVPIAADRAGLLIQSLAPGRSLQDRLDAHERFSEEQLLAIARQVLEVLTYLGRLRPPVVHRDLKPANLLMDDRAELHVVDFGAVKHATAQASTIGSTVAGTFGFMAPEQLTGVAEPRSDLYSLGMTLVALLTDVAPNELPQTRLKPDFRGHAHVLEGRPSTALLDFVERLVEPVPDDRFDSPKAALVGLEDVVVSRMLDGGSADVETLVAAREVAERRARQQAELDAVRARDQAIARLSARPARVVVARQGQRTRIRIGAKLWRDQLAEQLPWGFGFAFINPGIFIVMGLGAFLTLNVGLPASTGVPLAIGSWIVLLTMCNLIYGAFERRRHTLDLTEDGHFVLYRRSPEKPLLFGRRRELKIDIDDDDAALGEVEFSDGRQRIEIDKLTPSDRRALREGLR